MGRVYDIVKTEQDLTYLTWDEVACPSGLTGARPKAREGTGPNAVFYKQRHTGELGRKYRDCIAEIICSRLYELLNIEHVSKQLVRAKIADNQPAEWVIRSRSYRRAGERAVSLEMFYGIKSIAGETPLRMCQRMGWQEQINGMVVADFITATRSRDAACFEVIADRNGSYRLSPLMPRSFSLMTAFPRGTWRTRTTADLSTANYLGSRSLRDNLALLPEDYRVPAFNPSAHDVLLAGLHEVTSDKEFLDASWEIIRRRWELLENIRGV